VRVRWASLNKSVKKVVPEWDAIVLAAQTPLPEPRACHSNVRRAITEDPLLLCKIVFLREFSRKMLVHIEFFEFTDAGAQDVYARLVAIQESFNPLFKADEINSILQHGRCPDDRRDDMKKLITLACNAARNDWLAKMTRNQDGETIAVYQMIAVFDPSQKDAFTFTSAELLRILRPIHDSIYGPTEVGYDPLKVTFPHFLQDLF
jgi:hypothetical protein